MSTNIIIGESFLWSLGSPRKSEGKFRLFLLESGSHYSGEIIWRKLVNKVPLWHFAQEICPHFDQRTLPYSVVICLSYKRIRVVLVSLWLETVFLLFSTQVNNLSNVTTDAHVQVCPTIFHICFWSVNANTHSYLQFLYSFSQELTSQTNPQFVN